MVGMSTSVSKIGRSFSWNSSSDRILQLHQRRPQPRFSLPWRHNSKHNAQAHMDQSAKHTALAYIVLVWVEDHWVLPNPMLLPCLLLIVILGVRLPRSPIAMHPRETNVGAPVGALVSEAIGDALDHS